MKLYSATVNGKPITVAEYNRELALRLTGHWVMQEIGENSRIYVNKRFDDYILQGGIMFSLKPKEETFFVMFREHAGIIKEGSLLMQNMMLCKECRETRMAELLQVQQRGDEVIDTIMKRLDETFITPFDREDIYSLARGLDEILDAICASVDKMVLYKIGKPLDDFKEMVDVFGRNTKAISETVLFLKDVKKNYETIMAKVQEIKAMESEGDHLYREGIAKLFEGDIETLEVIKWKEVYQQIEKAMDRCEKVAKTIQGLVLKYA